MHFIFLITIMIIPLFLIYNPIVFYRLLSVFLNFHLYLRFISSVKAVESLFTRHLKVYS